MSIVVVVLVLCLVAACVRNRQLRRRLVAAEAMRELGDDGILAELEVHAISSPLARRLLDAANKPVEPSGSVTPVVAPAPAASVAPVARVVAEKWQHTTAVPTPPHEHWNLFVKDMKLEADDLGRAVCLDRWLEDGTKFTHHERVETVAMFQGIEWRDAARAAFIRAKLAAPTAEQTTATQ